jgi:hypothetical protein
MKKMKTVFKKDLKDLGRVINEVDPENQWVLDGEGVATRKWDGTACMVFNGELYKRYDCKRGKTPPESAIPCQEPDLITGHWPHWVKCDRDNPADKYHWEGWVNWIKVMKFHPKDATYELVGPRINGNKQGYQSHELVRHFDPIPSIFLPELTFESIRDFLEKTEIEGIVFHHPDGRMAKIRRSDFGFKW